MPKYTVKSTPQQGFALVFRSGRGWPAEGTEVNLDSAAEKDDHTRNVITEKTLKELQADPRISVTMEGAVEEIGGLRKQSSEKEAELITLRRRCAELEGQLGERDKALGLLREGLPARQGNGDEQDAGDARGKRHK